MIIASIDGPIVAIVFVVSLMTFLVSLCRASKKTPPDPTVARDDEQDKQDLADRWG